LEDTGLSVCMYTHTYYMGWKVPGFLMKISVFWAKLYLFLNIVAFEGNTLGIAIFQHFDAPPFCSTKRPSLRNMPRFPRWLIRCEFLSLEPPLEVWEQIIVAEGQVWRIRWATNSNRNWSNLAIAFKDVCDGALSMIQNEGESSVT